MPDYRIVETYDQSPLKVIDPDIDFFINKFKNDEYFCWTHFNVEWWLLARDAFKKIGYNNADMIGNLSRDELKKILPAVSEQMTKIGRKPYVFTDKVILDIMNMIVSEKENNFIFSASERHYYTGDKLPQPLNNKMSRLSLYIKNLLPKNEIPFNSICFRKWGQNGEIRKLMSAIQNHNVIMVGPTIYRYLGERVGLKNFYHINVSILEGSKFVDKYKSEMLALHKKIKNKNNNKIIYFFSCGCVGIWLINNIFNKDINDCFMLSIGRSFDAYFHYKKDKYPNHRFGPWLDKWEPIWAKNI